MTCQKFNTFLLALTLAVPALAQMPPELDAYIEHARVVWDVPGIAVTIVRDGHVVATKGYGVRTLGKPERVDENTMFDIASLSKSFTAAAIATLVDEGKMRWDDPVRRYLPQLEFPDAYRTQNVTIRDLLTHRTGLEPGNFMFRFTDYSTAEVLRRIRFLKEREPFRAAMIYSNVGYTAAGEAAAAAANLSWTDLVRTRLVEPLGMRDTTVGAVHDLGGNYASPHAIVGGVHQPIRNKKAMNIFPANGVNSNAKDMAKWLLFQLGDGTWEGKRIVSAEAMNEMHSPQVIIPVPAPFRAARGVRFFASYGFGWQVMDFRGHPMMWHSGSADGMPVYMAILPDDHIGVAVLTNTWAAPILHGALASRILDTLLGEQPRDWAGEALESYRKNSAPPPPPARVSGTSPSRPLDAYAGLYNDPLYGDMDVRLENSKLALYFAGHEAADLEHWHYDTFRAHWRDRAYEDFDTLVAFGLDTAGVPRRLDMRLNRDDVSAVRK
jgi:CubicO group peptidase (beta-lactamase class C family)